MFACDAYTAAADTDTAQEQIQQAANSFLTAYLPNENSDSHAANRIRRTVTLGNIATLNQFSACAETIKISPPSGNQRNGKFSLRVRCNTPSPWSLYLPVEVREYQKVVVTATPLIRGTALTAEQLQLQEVETTGLPHGFYKNEQEVLGFITKRSFRANEPISPNGLIAAILINKGDQIVIKASMGNTLSIRTLGEALANGALGDVIHVRNKNSQKVVEGRITASGVVEVAL
jgi:flagellar basal body P-ring formation protein FlgA